MARIRNVELPKEKRTEIGLTYIYGIGRSTAEKICKDANVDSSIRIKDLSTEQEAALRREVQMNIKGKMEINSYQGVRHKKGLPVHGQRTSRNAKTRKGKGKVVANKKKVGK